MKFHGIVSMVLCLTLSHVVVRQVHAADIAVRRGVQPAPATIVFLGGGNVEHGRYPAALVEYLNGRSDKPVAAAVNVSADGMSAELGAFRTRNDVLSARPNLVIVDFTAELAAGDRADAERDGAQRAAAIEGIIRQCWRTDPSIDLLLIDDSPAIEAVADHYGIASIRVQPAAAAVRSSASAPTTRDDPIATALVGAWPALTKVPSAKHAMPAVMDRRRLENVTMAGMPTEPAGWVELNAKETPEFDRYRRWMPRMWQAEPGAAALVLPFTARSVSLQVLSMAGSGSLTVQVDHDAPMTIRVDDPDHAAPHGRVILLAKDLAAGEHRLRITTSDSPVTIGEFLFAAE